MKRLFFGVCYNETVMFDASRQGRQLVIGTVYLVLFIAIGTGVYFGYIKPKPTCFDGKMNQDELGIDCGGICALCPEQVASLDLQTKETVFVPSGQNRYDVMAKVYNPNDTAGASSFEYQFELKDAAGRVLASRTGKNFILPQETKYLLEFNLDVTDDPSSATLTLSHIDWQSFSGYSEKPSVNIYQKRYSQISSGSGYSEAFGLVSNQSPYDFRSLLVKVILRDADGQPLAFNQTEMRTVVSHAERDFRLVWPNAFPGTVEKVEMEVEADVYHSDNFIQQYLPGGQFQEFAPTAS